MSVNHAAGVLAINMKYSKIYTKRGDKGETSLWSGERVQKSNIRIEAVGVFDELNAAIGVAFCHSLETKMDNDFRTHTADALTSLMGEIAYSQPLNFFSELYIEELDNFYHKLSKELDNGGDIDGWVLYGSTGKRSAYYDWAGTIARKAEVLLYKLKDDGIELSQNCYKYMNMLSKVLFLLARF